ncbi:unnamed protein product, partial [Tilletia laevis]
MLFTTRILARASDHVSPSVRSAVARFFDTPELVLTVLEHLHQDRIDLLAVAAVSKQLRALALQVWIRHFDFGSKSYQHNLKLVQANNHLLAHIRCLRIVNCKGWHGQDDHKHPPFYWSQVQTLFSLLAAHTRPHAQGPLLDININIFDSERLLRALQQHPKSIQRISALRLLYRTRFSYTNGKYVDADQNACSTGCWTALALLFNEALSQRQTGSALRVLDYQSDVDPTEVDEADRAARLNFWSTLTAHASLHGLRLRFSVGDSVTYLLRHGSFPSLKNVEFSSGSLRGEPQLYLIVDAFLHRHTGLQQLYLILYRPASAPLILDQTFPALHTLELDSITSSTVSSERVLDLLRRHPGLRQTTTLWERDALHSLLSSNAQMYKHLPVPANATPNDLSDLVKSGARPLRARVRLTESPIPARSSNSDDTRFFDLGFKDWYGIRPEHLEDLTYLQVICCNVTFPSLVRRSYQLFASDFLPALTSAPHEGPARRGPPEARTFGLT